MKYGLTLPNAGVGGDVATLVDLAVLAEESGWDGVFVWDSLLSDFWDRYFADRPDQRAACDTWIALAAIAAATRRVRIGPMVAALPRRRPWKVAREVVTLDHMSGGRMVLPAGLGDAEDRGFASVGEPLDRRTRAGRLDEALAIIDGLSSPAAEPFSFTGEHFRVEGVHFHPPSVQRPRVPVWVVGAWPHRRSIDRAVRWDGIVPTMTRADAPDGMRPSDIGEMTAAIAGRVSPSFDVVWEGNTSRDPEKAAAVVQPFRDAGVTWWVEGVWSFMSAPDTARERIESRIRAGPPPVA